MSNQSCDITRLMRFKALCKDAPRQLAPSRGLYPSGQFIKIGGQPFGKCPRSVYYDNKFPEQKKISFRMTGMANMGNLIESMLIDWTRDIGAYITGQLQIVDPENYWSGKVDILTYEFEFDDFNTRSDIKIDFTKRIPIEVKSVYGYNGSKGVIVGNSKTRNAPKPNAVCQLALYLDYLQRKGFDSPYGIIWYISRDEGESKSYKMTIEPRNMADGSVKRYIRIDGDLYHNFTIEGIVAQNLITKEFIDNNTVPPREYTLQYDLETLKRMAEAGDLSKADASDVMANRFIAKGDVECAYCDFSAHCYKEIARNEDDVRQELYLDINRVKWSTI